MQDYEAADCPMPEPFRAKIGITVFLAFLFYQGFITRVIFAPLMPAIEADMGLSHAQAGGLFLMISIGFLLAPLCSGLLSSKINHRGTLNVSAWVIGLILIPFVFVDSIWALRGLLVVIGLAGGSTCLRPLQPLRPRSARTIGAKRSACINPPRR